MGKGCKKSSEKLITLNDMNTENIVNKIGIPQVLLEAQVPYESEGENFIFEPPKVEDVYKLFLSKIGSDEISERMTVKFFKYYHANKWTIKDKKGNHQMKSWQKAVSFWKTKMVNYNKKEHIAMVSQGLFGK